MLGNINSVKDSISLMWLAIALHVASALVSLMELAGQPQFAQWLLVDLSAVVLFFLLQRLIRQRSRVARWVMLPAAFISAPLILPEQFESASMWVLWFACFQCVVQVLAAAYLFKADAKCWFQKNMHENQNVL
jgi:hypothetical protein